MRVGGGGSKTGDRGGQIKKNIFLLALYAILKR